MINWSDQAATIGDGLAQGGETIEYTPRGGVMFEVKGTPTKPSDRDITAGVQAEAQKVKFSPLVFLAASGSAKPRRGDVVEFGGRRYAVERVNVVRRGGYDLVYNCFAAGVIVIDYHFRLSDQDMRALKCLAQREDRTLASMLRMLIRTKALSKGLYGPTEVPRRADQGTIKA